MSDQQMNSITAEIELLLSTHQSVRELKMINRENKLQVYIVGEENQIRSNQILSKMIKKSFPDFNCDLDFIWVDEITETSLKQVSPSTQDTGSVTQLNKFGEDVFKIWGDILGKDNIGVEESFFDIGGDSLKCVEVLYQINEKYPEVTLVDLFKFTSIGTLSAHIESLYSVQSKATVEKVSF